MIWLAAILSSVSYRVGGMPRPCRSWMRDWIIPGIVIASMIFIFKIKAPWWIYLLSYPLMGGALSTYWDRIFGYDNFYAHGFVIGTGLLPLVLCGSLDLLPFMIRAVVLCLAMGSLNYIVNKFHVPFSDWIEELGRGAFIILSLLLL